MQRRSQLLGMFALLLIAFACTCAGARAQTRSEISNSPFSPAPYRVGERLSYNVSFSNFPTAAHVELTVSGRGNYFGREGFEIRAHVETVGVVQAALYAINNDYITYVDATSGTPYRIQQIVRTGTQIFDESRDLNPTSAPAIPAQQTTGVFPGSFDFLSALYRVRALPLAQAAVYGVSVQNGANYYEAEVRVTGREVVKTNVGSSNTVATQLRVRNNPLAAVQRLQINFSDDELHVPVLISVRHRAGEIRAELASSEMLTDIAPPAAGTNGNPLTPNNPPGIPLPPQTGGALAPPANGGVAATRPPAAGAVGVLPELPFKVGEQLNFTFYLGNTPQPIGTASFQVRAQGRYFNREGLLLSAVMQTSGAGQTLFPVNDQFNSYVDTRTLLPFRTELSLQEGRRRASFIVSTDQNGGNALFADGTRVEVPVGTHDLLSVFYALRSFDLTKANAVSLLINKRPRRLLINNVRRETITLGDRQIPAVVLSLVTNDPQGDRFSLRLWVSTDRRRLPLRLTAQTPVGPIRADLAIIPTTFQ